MTQPTHAKYPGPIESLKGCAVLVRACDKDDTVEAQFTDVHERSINDIIGKNDVSDNELLMFGWHEMPKGHFVKVAKTKTKKPGRIPAASPDKAGWTPDDE